MTQGASISRVRIRNRIQQRWYAPALLLLLVPLSSAAEVFQAVLDNPNQRFHEVHEPEVNVSGHVIVGVMTESVSAALVMNSVGISNAASAGGKVCLKVISRDGAYRSQNDYRIDAPPAATVYLPYRSGMKRVLASYLDEGTAIAVAATTGACADSDNASFLLPAQLDQGEGTLASDNVAVLVNGFDATDVFYRIGDLDSGDLHDCPYIEEGRHTAFNFVCNIPFSQLTAAASLQIEISREVYGRELEPIRIDLLLPSIDANSASPRELK